MDRITLVLLLVAIAVAAAAPFVASSNPDGLEKSAEEVGSGGSWAIDAPVPDYYGSGVATQVFALVLGALAVFGFALAGGKLLNGERGE